MIEDFIYEDKSKPFTGMWNNLILSLKHMTSSCIDDPAIHTSTQYNLKEHPAHFLYKM